ncbi:hypothetical protein K3495_g2557 [Podosphaera aphanis]|nr:hypothetical protein K3495_g2557 [Podosphaera aphanis]
MTPKISKDFSGLITTEISSPPRKENPPSRKANTFERERKNASVTPRKFKRFFTPRNLELGQKSATRQALYEATRSALNFEELKSSPACSPSILSCPTESYRESKRRKRHHVPSTTQENLSTNGLDCPRVCVEDDQFAVLPSSPCERAAMAWDSDEDHAETGRTQIRQQNILQFKNQGLSGRLLERSYGSFSRTTRRDSVYPAIDFQDHTAAFYSSSNDAHHTINLAGPGQAIPFCVAPCHTNSLIAVGDHEGYVRLLEAGDVENSKFSDIFLSFRVHRNAITDMNFSEDDSRLVTASGDQSARIVDMRTQTTISVLGAHTSSLKQARFQPGLSNNNVVATSGRDGSIYIWDLRCKGYDKPLIPIYGPSESEDSPSETRKHHYSAIFNSIHDAHKTLHQTTPPAGVSEFPKDGESVSRRAERLGDVSVTAIEFLSAELNHLLLSASEASSSVKLWDIRQLRTSRRHQNKVPLTVTAPPQSHTKWRQFGISSISLSSDRTRIYTLSKDSTVYAYSSAHLMLGQSPSLAPSHHGRPGLFTQTQEGLGPLYGFRHRKFHASTFYVQSAIRKPERSMCELLAVGSGDGCAVIFPTDERYIPFFGDENSSSFSSEDWNRVDDIPISTRGTSLIRGHEREVGSVKWAQNGALVTVDDAFLVRVWREGDEARQLRIGGEGGGRRWNCGWAEVDGNYDDDEQ